MPIVVLCFRIHAPYRTFKIAPNIDFYKLINKLVFTNEFIRSSYLNLAISTARGQPGLRRMPVTSVNRTTVSGELQLTLVGTLQIPQLNGSVFGDRSKHIRILWTEFHIPDCFGIRAKCVNRLVGSHVKAFNGSILGTGDQEIRFGTMESDLNGISNKRFFNLNLIHPPPLLPSGLSVHVHCRHTIAFGVRTSIDPKRRPHHLWRLWPADYCLACSRQRRSMNS